MARGIQLNRHEIRQANHWYLRIWRIRVDVEAVAGGMEREIFLWRQNDPDPHTNEVTYEFVTVATVADMSAYPVGGPNPNSDSPYFRTDYFELDLQSQEDYDEVWRIIQIGAVELAHALDRSEELQVVESVWLGTSPE